MPKQMYIVWQMEWLKKETNIVSMDHKILIKNCKCNPLQFPSLPLNLFNFYYYYFNRKEKNHKRNISRIVFIKMDSCLLKWQAKTMIPICSIIQYFFIINYTIHMMNIIGKKIFKYQFLNNISLWYNISDTEIQTQVAFTYG